MGEFFSKFYGVPLNGKSTIQAKLLARFSSGALMHLAEAEHWGKKRNKNVRVNVAGLGTGVWANGIKTHITPTEMNALIMRSYISLLSSGFPAPKVTVVEFNYSDFLTAFKKYKPRYFQDASGLTNEGNGRQSFRIKGRKYVLHTKGTATDGHPFVKVPELIVANYAWDSNSFPGNEYWGGKLAASGDPAAASCSTIWNHMNPECNGKFMSGHNPMVVQKDGSM